MPKFLHLSCVTLQIFLNLVAIDPGTQFLFERLGRLALIVEPNPPALFFFEAPFWNFAVHPTIEQSETEIS